MKYAIFDYDNTLSDGFARYKLGYALEDAGIIEKGLKKEIEDLLQQHKAGKLSYNDKFQEDAKVFSKYFKGVEKHQIEQFLSKEFDLGSSIFPWSHQLLDKLSQKGYLTVILSSCWEFVLDDAQMLLDFDTFYGTALEFEDGKLTGNYTRLLDNKMKNFYAKQLIEQSEHTLGVGDSPADLEFLKLCNAGFLYKPGPEISASELPGNIAVVDEKDIVERVTNSTI